MGDRKWESCSGSVHEAMMADWMVNIEPEVPPMLEAGVRGLVYAGDKDFICNWLGNQQWTLAMVRHAHARRGWGGQRGAVGAGRGGRRPFPPSSDA